MKPTTRLTLRAVLPVFVVSVVVLAAITSGVVSHVQASSARDGFRATEIRVEGSGDGTRVVMVQDSISTVVLTGADLAVPVGRPTIFATFTDDDELEQLAITTGEEDLVDIGARSTAASLVALSPGVLTAKDSWLGTVGHVVNGPGFDGLVDAVAGSGRLTDDDVGAALAAALEPLSVVGSVHCEVACGEWLAATDAVVVENATVSRAVLVPRGAASERICGSVPPAERRPGEGALITGIAAASGGTTDADVSTTPELHASLTRVEPGDCDRDLDVVTAGVEDEPALRAAWSTLLTDYARPLIDVVGGQVSNVVAEELDALADTAVEEALDPTVTNAMDLLEENGRTLNDAQWATAREIIAAVGGGLLDPAALPGSRKPVIDAAEPAPAAPAPAPGPTPTTTAPPPAAPVFGGALATSYRTGQDRTDFVVTVSATNTGEAAIDMGATSFRLVDGPGSPLSPKALSATFEDGRLDPGASREGTMTFSLAGPAGDYRLDWRILPDLVVKAEL